MRHVQRQDLHISTCPKCVTRLICGRIIVAGYHQCPKCKRYWVIEMDDDKVIVTPATRYFEEVEKLFTTLV